MLHDMRTRTEILLCGVWISAATGEMLKRRAAALLFSINILSCRRQPYLSLEQVSVYADGELAVHEAYKALSYVEA